MANKPTSPQDVTGRAAEDAARRNSEALKARAEEISVSRAAEEYSDLHDVFDPKNPDKPLLIDEIEEVGVSVNNDNVIIRTVADIDDMTFGVGNNYSFKQGKQYTVSRDLAAHLARLGYIYR